jgi:hypothetical protein
MVVRTFFIRAYIKVEIISSAAKLLIVNLLTITDSCSGLFAAILPMHKQRPEYPEKKLPYGRYDRHVCHKDKIS